MEESLSYYIFSREEWADTLDYTGSYDIQLPEEELQNLKSVNDHLTMGDVRQIYLPIIQTLEIFYRSHLELAQELEGHLDLPKRPTPFFIGVSGSVAVGKSTFSRLLQNLLQKVMPDKQVDLVTTDGFLYPNEVLEERGIMNRKGFPESYDMASLIYFLQELNNGKKEVEIPVYSHKEYDILEGQSQIISQPDIIIIEGINVLQMPQGVKLFVSDYFDFSFYIDASVDNIVKWYIQRFLKVVSASKDKPDDYFYGIANKSQEEVVEFAHCVWDEVNAPNLENYILPTRSRANMIVHKTDGHYIDQILLRKD